MNKAEERAEDFCKSTIAGSSYIKRMAYIQGYNQAEKDLELTWEDMRYIYDLAYNLKFPHKKQKEFFEEVLKRFKERRE